MADEKKNATIKDIARELGLSAMAVSKALNNKPGVKNETREKILQTAKNLDYKPNNMAQSLKLNRSKTIGVVASDSSSSFLSKVVRGIEDAAEKEGYNIIVCNTDSDAEKEKKAINVLISKRIDGIVLASSMLTGIEYAGFLDSLGIPCVFAVRRSDNPKADTVVNDNVLGAYQMVRYLLKGGCGRIHFINMTMNSPSSADRLAGYKKALGEAGIAYDPRIVFNVSPYIDDGYIMMRQILNKDREVKCVFCGCDTVAIGAMEALVEHGLRIPQDVQLAGYDDIEFAAYLRVPLTTMNQPKYLIGTKSVEVLMKRIRNLTDEVQNIIVRSTLSIRESTLRIGATKE